MVPEDLHEWYLFGIEMHVTSRHRQRGGPGQLTPIQRADVTLTMARTGDVTQLQTVADTVQWLAFGASKAVFCFCQQAMGAQVYTPRPLPKA